MGLAIQWILEAGAVGGAFVVVAMLAASWRRARALAAACEGRAATGTLVSLEILRVGIGVTVAGILVGQIGLVTVSALLVAVGLMVGFIATCGVGLCLPNLSLRSVRVE